MARDLLKSLTPEQRARAVIAESAPGEIITGASRKAEIAEAKGLPAGEMTEKQRATFTALLRAYVEAMPQTIADERLARLRQAGMEKIRTQNNANHIHTVWRDFHGDFGEDLLREHYRAYHQPAGASH
jgi:hypothetical protein